MIAYLRGRVLAITAETAILDIGGVGYEVYCSGSAFSRMAQGEQTELFTHLQVKEDGMTLFGFSSEREKQTFLKLIGVSGVGPKMGIGILSTLSGEELAHIVVDTDFRRQKFLFFREEHNVIPVCDKTFVDGFQFFEFLL